MKILMTGGTGLVGCEVGRLLSSKGHELVVISRSRRSALKKLTYKAEIIEHDLSQVELDSTHFSGIDAIINLAGETVDGRWTEEKKQLIRDSRIKTTENLLKNCPSSVKLLISASAQGYYGEGGNNDLDESSPAGEGFLAEVCKDWEMISQQFKGQRNVTFRIGLVLSKKGGALPKLVSLFRKNLGARLGNGKQWMSWISLDDLANHFVSAISDENINGVINAVNNYPITNSEFTEILCRAIKAPQFPPAPEFAIKTVLGEMSSLVLGSLKVFSRKAPLLNLNCRDRDLESFLGNELSFCADGESYFYAEQFVPRDIEEVFRFFSDAYNLEKITPDTLNFKILSVSSPTVIKGTLIDYKLKIHHFPIHWRTEITDWEPPQKFSDQQLKGPYKLWFHTHYFEKVNGGTLMRDLVKYKLPMGALGNLIGGLPVESDIQNIFEFRRKKIIELFS